MHRRKCPHRRGPVGIEVFVGVLKLLRVGRVLRGKRPAREGFGKSFHLGLAESGDRFAVGAHLGTAVQVQFHQADRKQLQHFTCVVFIRMNSFCRIVFLALDHVQVVPHGGVQRDFFEQTAVVAKRVSVQYIHVRRHGVRPQVWRHVGDHHDLRQRKCHAPAQLVRPLEPLLPDGFITHVVIGTVVGGAHQLRIQISGVGRSGRSELAPKPVRKPFHPGGFNLFHRFRAKTRLRHEAGRIRRTGPRVRTGQCGLVARQNERGWTDKAGTARFRCRGRRTAATATTAGL